jgi:ribosomal protein L14E/L6E/L27E
LNGRHAGKKAVIIENIAQSLCYPSNKIMVLGIKAIPKKKLRKNKNNSIKKKLRIKVFFKTLNKKHIFPTRYFVDLNLEQQNLITQVSNDLFKLKSGKDNSVGSAEKIKMLVNNIFMDKYFSGKNKWFFKKLKF